MLTPYRRTCESIGWIRARWATETRTRGGSRETEMKALAVMPWGFSSWTVLTMVTPLAQWERVFLKRAELTGERGEGFEVMGEIFTGLVAGCQLSVGGRSKIEG